MFGLAARAQLLSLSRAMLANEASVVLRELDELVRNGKDLGRLLNDLLHHFRNLLVFEVTGGDLSLLEISEAEGVELQAQAAMAPAEAVSRVLEVLSTAEGRLRDASARKIFLEVTLMKAMQARGAVSLNAVLKQLQELRQEAGGGEAGTGGITTRPPEARLSAPATVSPLLSPTSSVAGSAPTAPTVPAVPAAAPVACSGPAQLWTQVIAAAGPMIRPVLQVGIPLTWEKGVLTVGFPGSHDAQRVMAESDRTRKTVETKLAELGLPGTVRFIRIAETPGDTGAVPGPGPGFVGATASTAAAPGSVGTGPAPLATGGGVAKGGSGAPGSGARVKSEKVVPLKISEAEFKDDPLIKEALELFKGHLVRVPNADPDAGAGAR